LDANSVGMLTTQFSGGLRARPLDARPDRESGAIHFITDVRGHKDDEIEAKPDVCFVAVVPKDNAYLSITGRASAKRDPAKARQIRWWPPTSSPRRGSPARSRSSARIAK